MAAIVLAGGRSLRFGSDKAAAPFAGRPLLQWVVDAVAVECDEVVVVRASAQVLPEMTCTRPTMVAVDDEEAHGPVHGLLAGLSASGAPWVFAVGCDTPLVRPALVRELWRLARGYDGALPIIGRKEQPLVAVYRREPLLEAVQSAASSGEGRLLAAIAGLALRRVPETELVDVDPELDSFKGANTAAELAQLLTRIPGEPGAGLA